MINPSLGVSCRHYFQVLLKMPTRSSAILTPNVSVRNDINFKNESPDKLGNVTEFQRNQLSHNYQRGRKGKSEHHSESILYKYSQGA